jgi:hypothetical protein
MELLNIPPAGALVSATVCPTTQGDTIRLYYSNGTSDITICSFLTDPWEIATGLGAVFLQARAAGYEDCQADLQKQIGIK